MLIHNQLYRNGSCSEKFIPIILSEEAAAHIPDAVYQYSRYDFSKARAFENLYRHLRGELGAEKPPLGQTHFQRTIHSDDLPAVEGELFGRQEELALLDKALNNADTHIVQFVASGGTGKTKLLRHWLDDNHNKIEALIAWSFYSQGSSEDKQISATPFFMQALKSLGSDKTISDFNTEEEKGEYIADLLREKRCLLVLDGLEPLQQVGRGMRGELKDRAIRKLLRCLVGDHSSLCIITTRLPVYELKGRRYVVQHDLRNLAPEDGVDLLRSFGVSGRDVDMLAAVDEYGRHALALHLLGNALATYLDGDVRKRDTLTELIGDYDDLERHAFKVMQAYEHWLVGTPELKLLYLLGLFDHPVSQDVLAVLWKAEIPGLTEVVDKKAWQVAQRDLVSKYRMMSEIPSPQSLMGQRAKNDTFDCHPLIREYFGRQLKESQGEVWRQAHTVLYEYYKGLPEKLYGKYLPDTLEEMQPLFRAVAHGCAAGLYQQAWDKVYWERIQRKEIRYLDKKIGDFNIVLSMIAPFFLEFWVLPHASLSTESQASILNYAGLGLKSIGRLVEAENSQKITIEILIKNNDWENISINFSNLSELQLGLGMISDAKYSSSRSLIYAKKSKRIEECIAGHASNAAVLHQAGRLKQALGQFNEAEKYNELRTPKFPCLYSLPNFLLCDLLIDVGRYLDAMQYARYDLDCWINHFDNGGINEYSLPRLTLGRALACMGEYDQALNWLGQSVTCFRTTGSLEHLSHSLIASSKVRRLTKKLDSTLEELKEVYDITSICGMRLHLTEYHLEMARLILAVEADLTQYPEATPDRKQRTLPFADQQEPSILTLEGHITEAARLIEETGYHRRDAELAELQKAVGIQ